MTLLTALFAAAALVLAVAGARYLNGPLSCLLVVLTGVVFGHAFYNRNVGPIPVTLDRVLWGALILQFLVLIRLGYVNFKPLSRTDVIILLLGLLLTASTFLHDWHYKENMPLSRLLFFNWMPIGIYFVAKHSRLHSKQLNGLYLALIVFGAYLSVTAIAEQRGWQAMVFPRFIVDSQYVEFLGRARGPFLNPVSCGIYLITCTAAAWLMWPRVGRLGKSFIVVLACVMLFATFLTFTRSVWVGALLAAVIIIWIPSTPAIRGALIVAGTVGLLAVLTLFSDRLNSFKRDKHVTAEAMAQSASLRPMLAHVALKMFRDRPILGCGFGQYTQYKKPYHYDETANMPLRKVLPYMQHNVFLSYLTETGLAGLSLLVALLVSVGLKAWRLWRSWQLSLAERQLGLLAMVVLTGYCINGMFHDVSIIPHVGALLFLLIGLVENVSAQSQSAGQNKIPSRDHPLTQAA